ncbi:sterigmatocystin biosynthesis lipase esterase stci [Diplodia corticola]|uniref:Sterigmatocystin biosynthesis lipase esterase stci n=1 Tax=Diplodia corticola TaxID=236234 RepID=A0A1J9RYK9_9PEZI|nr:sterigmatocystin biosynthesis lipase esterase stci [Diplodia corticola]OJD37755.1 sterigmatocystin biosynthesis lipase esterase stci [Diplodia corticola]
MGGRKHLSGTLTEKRAQFNSLCDAMQAAWPQPLVDGEGRVVDVEVEDLTIPAPPSQHSAANNTTIPLRIYKPRNRPLYSKEPTTAPLPTIVWYHGGGWMAGTLDTEHAQCQLVAALVPAVVVGVGYGRLPERSTGGMLDDCVAGFRWAWENVAAEEKGGKRGKDVVVMGGSAGGALAFGVVRRLALAGEEARCAGAVGVFPVTVHGEAPPERWRTLHGSYRELWDEAPVVRGADQKEVLDIAAERSPEDPLLAVKFTYEEETLKKFPRTYIATAGKDLMRDDGVVLEAALKEAGVPVKRRNYEGLPHYFWFFPQLGEKTMRFIEELAEGVRWVLAEGDD